MLLASFHAFGAQPILSLADFPILSSVSIPCDAGSCGRGSAEEGFLAPPVVSLDTNIKIVKRANATVKHYGVMAHMQMRAVSEE